MKASATSTSTKKHRSTSVTQGVTTAGAYDTLAGTHFSLSGAKKIGLYRTPNFSDKTRIVWYNQEPRTRQPQFVVIGHAVSKHGHLRFKVRDVNHGSRTYGLVGYVTARNTFVKPTYYQELTKAKKAKHLIVTVINPKGVDSYKTNRQTQETKHYAQGQQLRVKRIVQHHLTTRFQLTNGQYITANKQWVEVGRITHPKQITVKKGANLYHDVNFKHPAGQHFAGQTVLKVLGWDHSDNGTLRYRVAGGYVTANPDYVQR